MKTCPDARERHLIHKLIKLKNFQDKQARITAFNLQKKKKRDLEAKRLSALAAEAEKNAPKKSWLFASINNT
jgi:hypothetical protein